MFFFALPTKAVKTSQKHDDFISFCDQKNNQNVKLKRFLCFLFFAVEIGKTIKNHRFVWLLVGKATKLIKKTFSLKKCGQDHGKYQELRVFLLLFKISAQKTIKACGSVNFHYLHPVNTLTQRPLAAKVWDNTWWTFWLIGSFFSWSPFIKDLQAKKHPESKI